MKLTKTEFVTHVSYLLKMSDEINQIVNVLGVPETIFIFDEWFDHYYTLIDNLCDFRDEDYNNIDGTPLDYWLNRAEGKPCIFPYHIKDTKEVVFNSTKDVYDFIVKSQNPFV